jgi:hypothetical protein
MAIGRTEYRLACLATCQLCVLDRDEKTEDGKSAYKARALRRVLTATLSMDRGGGGGKKSSARKYMIGGRTAASKVSGFVFGTGCSPGLGVASSRNDNMDDMVICTTCIIQKTVADT